MNNGYIKLWRKIQKTSFYKKPLINHLAVHLILEANHISHKFIWNKEELTIERGQVLTGRKALSDETGLSQRNIRTALKTLKNIGFLTSKVTSKFSVITICNYSKYQDCNYLSDQQSDQQVTSKRPASDQQATTYNNDKNDKHDKNKRFIPPTVDEVKAYCIERNNEIDPAYFVDKYIGNGWMVGTSKMKDWKAVVRTWERNKPKVVKQPEMVIPPERDVLTKIKEEIARRG